MVALLVSLGAIRPEPGPARSWLERELSRSEYRQSLTERFLSWLGDAWAALQASALGASPLSTAAAALAVVVLVVLVVLVAGRVRREPPRNAGHSAALGTGAVPAQEHRAAAEAAMSAGDLELTVVEGFRAVAARAVERGVLEERAGRTARELATDLAPAFPAFAEELAASSGLFDRVFYGHRSVPAPATGPATGPAVTRSEAQRVLALEDALRTARPGLPASDQPDHVTSVHP
jgi:hypothetical protein